MTKMQQNGQINEDRKRMDTIISQMTTKVSLKTEEEDAATIGLVTHLAAPQVQILASPMSLD